MEGTLRYQVAARKRLAYQTYNGRLWSGAGRGPNVLLAHTDGYVCTRCATCARHGAVWWVLDGVRVATAA